MMTRRSSPALPSLLLAGRLADAALVPCIGGGCNCDTAGVCCCDTFAAVTPPGYYTVEGVTLPCHDHTYREGWVPAAQAGNCTSCGEGVLAEKTDRLVQYFSNNSDVLLPVTSSAQDCCELPPPPVSVHYLSGLCSSRELHVLLHFSAMWSGLRLHGIVQA